MLARIRLRVVLVDDLALGQHLDQQPTIHRAGRRVVDTVDAKTNNGEGVDGVRLAGDAAIAIYTSVDAGSQGTDVGPREGARLVGVGYSLVDLGGACHAGVHDWDVGIVAGVQRWNVDVETVAHRQERHIARFVHRLAGVDNPLDDAVGNGCDLVGRMRFVLDVVVGDSCVRARNGDCRDTAARGSIAVGRIDCQSCWITLAILSCRGPRG